MTSPSLKNHPTTAQPKATRSNHSALWKRCLAGALCLFVSGAIPANDREVGNPLERLKQRSARTRWRELRGEWVPAPEAAPPAPAPQIAPDPFTAPLQGQVTPIPTDVFPAVSGSSTEQLWIAAPVPAPPDVTPEVDRQAFAHPSAKPPTDLGEPLLHPGSFGEVELETRVGTPREREEIPLPHWPFEDDLDLVVQPQADLDSAASSATLIETAPVAEQAARPELPVLSFPIQVAEVPTEEVPAATTPREPPAAEASLPQSEPATEIALTPEADPVHQLKSIRDIQPFYDYDPEGGDPNDTLCPRPANADPAKTYKQCPLESGLLLNGSLERNGSIVPVYWQASNVTHNPLYFENSGLERSGHTFSEVFQPFVSVGKFGAQVVALPYSIALDPVWKSESPLGHSRPGECASKRHLAVPINGRAAVAAAATYTGILFLIP